MESRTDGQSEDAPRPSSTDTDDGGGTEPVNTVAVWVGSICGVLLLLVVALSYFAQEHIYDERIPIDDWKAAAMAVREGYEPGDVVRIEPVWADTPRVFLEGALVDMTPQPERDVLDEYDRIWILAGYNRAAHVAQRMPGAYNRLSVETFGDVDLALYEVPAAAQPLYDFGDHIATAKVRRTYPDGRPAQRCTLWRDNAWHCGRYDQHLHVGRRMRDMDNQPRHCIYMPPGPDHAWIETTFEGVDLSQTLRGRVGMDNWAVRSERGSMTEFEVLIDGEVKHHMELPPRDPTYHSFAVETGAFEGKHDVTFRARAADFFDRFLCFNASVPSPGDTATP